MSSVNKAILVGYLSADPEVRTTPAGFTIANLRLATSERWKDKDGNAQERTEWHRVVCLGKLAELARDYLKKGRQVYIEGSLQTREWEKDGAKRYTTEIKASQIVFLGTGDKTERTSAPTRPERTEHTEHRGGGYQDLPQFERIDDSDVPF